MRRWKSQNLVIPKACIRKQEQERSRVRAISLPSLMIPSRLLMSLTEFTGISAPYETPEYPEIHLKTHELNVDEAVQTIVAYLLARNFIDMK